MKWQTLFQTKKTRSSNENDSDSLGLFKLLESRTFDYLSLFHGKRKREKSQIRGQFDGLRKKKAGGTAGERSEHGRKRLPRPETPPVRHAVIPLLFVSFPTVYPDVFRERSPVGHLPGHNYN